MSSGAGKVAKFRPGSAAQPVEDGSAGEGTRAAPSSLLHPPNGRGAVFGFCSPARRVR
jgi:hypothetical protein